ncbi:DUF1294 domain-containing protein [Romboutsia weinsteinii]|uniref:DUF1294 domain-containing protein n=1 Tax=Romboutsia weinsteinii TaxID=2020949 RepID=A0A371J5K3_9FIRM|nr:DUF1294 domain-containing protein [Romboutsia weinsteinii]RDY28029.1 DUF1294 domain-containing protein [Romboutsia weinsteinii]
MGNIFLYYILAINILAYFLMYIDKRKAIEKKWRIKEVTLISVALIGGSIGSILGMYNFRHKTKHNKFVVGIPIIIISQVILLIIVR